MKLQHIVFTEMNKQLSPAKLRPFHLSLNMLRRVCSFNCFYTDIAVLQIVSGKRAKLNRADVVTKRTLKANAVCSMIMYI